MTMRTFFHALAAGAILAAGIVNSYAASVSTPGASVVGVTAGSTTSWTGGNSWTQGATFYSSVRVSTLTADNSVNVGPEQAPNQEAFYATRAFPNNDGSTETVRILGDNGFEFNLELVSDGPQGANAGVTEFSYGGGNGSVGGYSATVAEGSEASPAATLDGDKLFNGLRGHNGTNIVGSKAAFEMIAAQNWTPTANGTKINFSATADGTTTRRLISTLDQFGFTMANNATSQGNITTLSSVTASAFFGDGSHLVGTYEGPSTQTTPSRVLSTVYQNAGAFPRYVSVVGNVGSNANVGVGLQAIVSATPGQNPPTLVVSSADTSSAGGSGPQVSVFFIVMPGDFYEVNDISVIATGFATWAEWQ